MSALSEPGSSPANRAGSEREGTVGASLGDPLHTAAPPVDDVEAQRARASIASRLFSGPAQPVEVGRYRVARRLGAGGMGVVYRAHDPELARDVAVKVLNATAPTASDPATARARLVREARAMARLAHPNVIAVHDVGTVQDGVFIAMELVEGHHLGRWVQQQQPPWREILRKYIDAGRGLAAAHAAGVVHRDFKPENVLVGEDGRVRVVDFGLAGGPVASAQSSAESTLDRDTGDLEGPSGSLTQTGTLLGTPKYMAPEQESGAITNAASDQFSFCVALYEALHGHPPFAGESVAEYRQNVRTGAVLPPPPQSKVRAWVNAEIVRGLAVDPADRHPALPPLLDRLEEVLVDPNIARRRRRRVRTIATLAGASALLLGGLGLWAARDEPTPDADATVVVQTHQPAAAAIEGAEPAATPPPDLPPPEPEPAPVTAVAGVADDTASDDDPAASSADPGTPLPPTTDEAPKADAPGPAEATPRPAKRRKRSEHCYFEQDRLGLLRRQRGRQRFVKDSQGRCYDCDTKAPEYRRASLDPSDCDRNYLCVATSEDRCAQ